MENLKKLKKEGKTIKIEIKVKYNEVPAKAKTRIIRVPILHLRIKEKELIFTRDFAKI